MGIQRARGGHTPADRSFRQKRRRAKFFIAVILTRAIRGECRIPMSESERDREYPGGYSPRALAPLVKFFGDHCAKLTETDPNEDINYSRSVRANISNCERERRHGSPVKSLLCATHPMRRMRAPVIIPRRIYMY